MIADQWLDALGNSQHRHYDNGTHIGYDRIAYNSFLINISKYRMVKKKDYDPRRKFGDSGGCTYFYGSPK